jgi:hypothetical protein
MLIMYFLNVLSFKALFAPELNSLLFGVFVCIILHFSRFKLEYASVYWCK